MSEDEVELLDDGQHAHLLLESGMSWRDIAADLGYPIDTVRVLAARYLAHRDAEAGRRQLSLF